LRVLGENPHVLAGSAAARARTLGDRIASEERGEEAGGSAELRDWPKIH